MGRHVPEGDREVKSLPEEFWSQDFEQLGVEPALQLIYAETCAELRRENPDADTMELMMIERVAYLYVFIRHKETRPLTSKDGFAHDRVHKETTQLWSQMMAELRKQRNRVEDQQFLRAQIVTAVKQAVQRAVLVLPADQQLVFQAKILDELEM